MLTLYY